MNVKINKEFILLVPAAEARSIYIIYIIAASGNLQIIN
jgi:hypothetical protein